MRFFHIFLNSFFILFFLIIFLNFPKIVFADEDFLTRYEIDYKVEFNGLTKVTNRVSLENKQNGVYPTIYKFLIRSTKISNIVAYDDNGPIKPEIVEKDNALDVSLPFNAKNIGIGKTTNLVVNYDTLDFANIYGKVLEIAIPKLADIASIDEFKINLEVPATFGEPAFILPKPDNRRNTGSTYIYQFSKTSLASVSGITAAFGQEQLFDFKIKYHLQNNQVTPAKYEVAFPPDTSYQTVILQSVDPLPQNINVDKDGNWIATYLLSAKQDFNLNIKGAVKIYINPGENNYPKVKLTKEEIKAYTSPDKYWESENSEIKKLAQELKTPQKIYQYVVNNLIYDYGRISGNNNQIERLGAREVLKKKNNSLCMEFTDLFIALSRAAGIPAREINGYAYTTNPKLRPLAEKTDVLHAWPEYYDSEANIWRQVDPTWGSTTGGLDYFNKLDLNHFAFVTHGVSSVNPAPPGSYNEDGEGKDIFIDFGEIFEPQPKPEVSLDFPQKILAGTIGDGEITIKNSGNAAVYNQILQITAKNINIPKANNYNYLVIPPFSQNKINLSSARLPLNSGATNFEITVYLGERVVILNGEIIPFLEKKFIILGSTITMVLLTLLVVVRLIWKKRS